MLEEITKRIKKDYRIKTSINPITQTTLIKEDFQLICIDNNTKEILPILIVLLMFKKWKINKYIKFEYFHFLIKINYEIKFFIWLFGKIRSIYSF